VDPATSDTTGENFRHLFYMTFNAATQSAISCAGITVFLGLSKLICSTISLNCHQVITSWQDNSHRKNWTNPFQFDTVLMKSLTISKHPLIEQKLSVNQWEAAEAGIGH
jgi:hypothetical protein